MRTKLLLSFVLMIGTGLTAFGSKPNAEMLPLDAPAILKELNASSAKLKIVNLWASWCAPCVKELPAFAQAERSAPKEVSFFYVSGDDDASAKEAHSFIKKTGVAGRTVRLRPINDAAFKIFAPTWSGTLPSTFFYGESGQLLHFTTESLSEKELSSLIKKYLKSQKNSQHSKTLHPSPRTPKIKSSQGMNKMKSVEFESKKANPEMPTVLDIVAEELNKKKSEVQLIDVRRPDEFNGELSHIPGAKLIVLDTLPQQISQLSKDTPIVFVCRSGGRSARAAAFAQQNGFSEVYNLKGGMLRWNELQLETESKRQ